MVLGLLTLRSETAKLETGVPALRADVSKIGIPVGRDWARWYGRKRSCADWHAGWLWWCMPSVHDDKLVRLCSDLSWTPLYISMQLVDLTEFPGGCAVPAVDGAHSKDWWKADHLTDQERLFGDHSEEERLQISLEGHIYHGRSMWWLMRPRILLITEGFVSLIDVADWESVFRSWDALVTIIEIYWTGEEKY